MKDRKDWSHRAHLAKAVKMAEQAEWSPNILHFYTPGVSLDSEDGMLICTCIDGNVRWYSRHDNEWALLLPIDLEKELA